MKTLLFALTAVALTGATRADVPWLDLGDVTRQPVSTDARVANLVLAAGAAQKPEMPLAVFDSLCLVWQLSNPLALFDSHRPGFRLIFR